MSPTPAQLTLMSAALLPSVFAATPRLPGVGAAMQAAIDAREIAGAVTLVVSKDAVLHLDATGFANLESQAPMQADHRFWIASMTKPTAGIALLMLQDEGRLRLTDLVEKHLPEFAALKTPSGQPARLTLLQLMSHTSGLGEGDRAALGSASVRTLADAVPHYLASPMQFEPGARWSYCQSGINTAARIVEAVSGQSFDAFLQQRLFGPLGMTSTTFYPEGDRLASAYAKNRETGRLEPGPAFAFGNKNRPPFANAGLFSTAADYGRLCQMLLNGGTLDGHRYLSAEAHAQLSAVQTGDLPTGFLQSEAYGRHGDNYGWGVGTCIVRAPHAGVGAMLSPGTYGHGGAWGTQAWIDPVKGVAYVMMVQRSNFPNSDASDVRRAFQQAAADALAGNPAR